MTGDAPTTDHTQAYGGECRDCGDDVKRSLPMDRLSTVPEPRKWVRCDCGAINWCGKE
jgi:hypothetical protein